VPEGDTVWRTATRLHQALAGHPVTRWDLRWGELATSDLVGASTLEVVSRGKHILQRLDVGVTLHSHLRMEGQWRIEDAGRLTARHLSNPQIRAVVGTERWAAIGLRLGMLDLLPTDQEHTLVGHLGPDVLGADWDVAAAVANLRAAGTTPIGAALLDQRNLAGVGTLWASESLFLERLHPWAEATSLGDDALSALVVRAHRLIDAARHHAIQTSTGVRRLGETSYVHGRSGRPCRRCGEGIRVAMIGEPPQDRTMFYCPRCQGGLGPTDDGRRQTPLGSGARGRSKPYRRV
jgi:endonuclease-8